MEKCYYCEGTGKHKIPKDAEEFDVLFDKFDAPGTISMHECRERALDIVGYDVVDCPKCNGTGMC